MASIKSTIRSILLVKFFTNSSFFSLRSLLSSGSRISRCSSNTVIVNALSMMIQGNAAVSTKSIGTMPPLLSSSLASLAQYRPLAEKAMEYFDDSTDPFHAVQKSIDLLKGAGFELVKGPITKDSIRPAGKYYYTKDKSTLVAFAVGGKCRLPSTADNGGCGCIVIGGHTDSPNLRVKPRSKRGGSAGGVIQLGVECYGGGLWNTWFDRDLGISGRVFIRTTGATESDSKIQQRLVKVDRPILRISNLAIHLQNEEERKAFAPNREEHLSPILSMEVQKALEGGTANASSSDEPDAIKTEGVNGWTEYQEPALLHILAAELCCNVSDIIDFELSLFDVQKAALGGAFSEFIYSARLDNLASCFMAVEALIEHVNTPSVLDNDQDVMMILLYDHEEVGSNSAVGAASPILSEAVKSISEALCDPDADKTAATSSFIRRSFVLSSDQAHAVHPNYASKHEKNHQPKLNQGMVIKRNSNQRYATTSLTGVLMREVARLGDLPPLQEFIVRQDCGCGSTIGPIMSTNTGIRTIDMGCPQLSMHSIREIMGMRDLSSGVSFFKSYFKHFRQADTSIEQ